MLPWWLVLSEQIELKMKIIFLSLFCVLSSLGQNTGQNVVSRITIPQQTIHSSTNFISSPISIQNIGQSSHIFKVVITTSSGSQSWSATMSIQGSNDGITWFNMGPTTITPFVGTTSTEFVTATGTQSYPYIRTNCAMTLQSGLTMNIEGTYTGNSSPSIIQVDGSQNIMQTTNLTNGTFSLPFSGSLLTGVVSSSAVIYGLDFYLPSTATTLELECSITHQDIVNAPTLPGTWYHLQQPVGIRPYGACSAGEGITLIMGGTGTVGVTMVYRIEQ